MPWCTGCDRFLSPNTVLADGSCPTCRGPIEEPPRGAARSAEPVAPPADATVTPGAELAPDALTTTGAEPDDDTPIPWHLWLLIAAVVVYLGYRAFQGLELLF